LRWLGLAVAVAVLPGLLLAADRRARAVKPAAETVEMFAGIKAGQIDVTLIPKDATQCNVLIKNKTDKPLSVKLPEAFAGVPVLAQMDMDMGGGFDSGGGGGGGGQAFGGGMGGMMGGGMGMMGGGMGMGMGGGGGMWNVAPEKVGKFKVTTVCLEHGKPDPRPAMKYTIKPIKEFTEKAEVRELLEVLGTGRVPQRVAQAAAWHLSNGMSWQELAAKELRFANGTRRPYFSRQEIMAGMQVAAVAAKRVEQRKSTSEEDYSLSKR
jgi:hypothetical protein